MKNNTTICKHNLIISSCKTCKHYCLHNKRKNLCKECGGKSICQHNRVKTICKDCGGSSICYHNKQRHICKECCGASICKHNRRRNICKECSGNSLCQHNIAKSRCIDCSNICLHKKYKFSSELCSTENNLNLIMCPHDVGILDCKECSLLF